MFFFSLFTVALPHATYTWTFVKQSRTRQARLPLSTTRLAVAGPSIRCQEDPTLVRSERLIYLVITACSASRLRCISGGCSELNGSNLHWRARNVPFLGLAHQAYEIPDTLELVAEEANSTKSVNEKTCWGVGARMPNVKLLMHRNGEPVLG